MSFDSRERSLDSGQPIRLYQFSRGVLRWLYNTSDRDITHNNQLFKAIRGGISDDGIRQAGETSVNALKITAPATLEVAQLYRGVPPSADIDLVIFDLHYGETDFAVAWVGEIAAVRWPAVDRCQITCDPMSVSMGQQGLRMTWERSCPHALYERGCLVNRDLFRVDADVQSLDGAAISSGEFEGYPDGYFTAGYVEWPIGSGEFERRAVQAHAGSVLQLLGGTAGIALGASVRAYPGCDQTMPTCDERFDNALNHGGVDLAGKSPFDGDPIF